MNKPTLTHEQARAIDLAKMFAFNIPTIIENVSKGKPFANPKYSALERLDIYTIMSALVNGYEIEKSPEEKLREYFNEANVLIPVSKTHYQLGVRDAVRKTVDILGITIEGINE
ncbi:hypothetical protein [Lederbergia citri]|uniref:Uncharacterized protein n=1 Tax=Lederbergia citri TaxID=2833580 RepID=A0A942TFU8_9BACI|nr:hypothetical protein [Lederbergia citri]MBS4195389.1 hypothetical protein [Lederbergia citri]